MSLPSEIETRFAPARRATAEQVTLQRRSFLQDIPLTNALNSLPTSVVMLNSQRQIVYANTVFLEFIGAQAPEQAIGLRPGEALRCIHSSEMPGGCGTTEFCSVCGSVRSILESQRGHPSSQGCRITRQDDLGALDLRISSTPLTVGSEQYTFFVALDASDENRRRILEHTFFHDLLNTAGGLQGCIDLMKDMTFSELIELRSTMETLVSRLVDEVKSQRELLTAERGEFMPKTSLISSVAAIESVIASFRTHPVANGRTMATDPSSANVTLLSEATLLQRVLGNLLKNALEATPIHGTVTVGCKIRDGLIDFGVRNDGVMPREVELQIFQRSFSTKGIGRGIGTYSVKLFTERYLHGTVSFVSNSEEGTVFRISLPLSANQ